MRRARRCPECKERFYPTEGSTICQHCAGGVDTSSVEAKDLENIKKANRRTNSGKAQSVDPRTGKPTPPKPPKKPEGS